MVVVGTVGYVLIGLSFLDALYQTVTTVTTVGFRELGEPTASFKLFTMLVALVGVGTALYTLGVLLESLVEGSVTDHLGRRRMQRRIDELAGHVIICGWGRVGTAIGKYLAHAGTDVVVIDRDADRVDGYRGLSVEGDATDENVLRAAGIERAQALIAALSNDPENLYVTLTARGLRSDLFIVARARFEDAEPKLVQAGADRVVNPQRIGGARMAALVRQPNVAEFLDVVMHEDRLEWRLEEVEVGAGSALAGRTLRDAQVRDQTGALILALRDRSGGFNTNPTGDARLEPGHVMIAIGTEEGLARLVALAVA
ncbi:MAG: potassium channel family protein [Acidimicrobiia bacterium]